MTRVVICAGGPVEELCDLLSYVDKETIVIGADRGALYCLAQGITPHDSIGDFDSVTPEEWQQLKQTTTNITRYPAEKDETDTNLALQKALQYNPMEVMVTGVTGGRLDHYEAVLRKIYALQLQFPHVIWRIVAKHNEVRFLLPGTTHIKPSKFPYVSFFAYGGDVQDVTIRGLKYETTNERMPMTSGLFTSNEFIASSATVTFHQQTILMIMSGD
ncbi:MAG TPA: thiamine diphosphokinase [Metalysinibacillus jejuensis]|uniref:Thiamine diphosphokinase n=1 Tax=Metalysinibacillus jejuensis TaxID=914327 RepID=A0A921NBH7_9BACL|nr:thiamine diphosphokinase [Metalysinibacillus jejuensis]